MVLLLLTADPCGARQRALAWHLVSRLFIYLKVRVHGCNTNIRPASPQIDARRLSTDRDVFHILLVSKGN